MAGDPYAALGLKRDATAAQIKAAYLKLAKKHHPDLNPDDAKAEERFKAVSTAHDLLSDPERRARFDRGEIDAAGQERPQARGFYKPGPGGDQAGRFRSPPDQAAFEDMFSGMFGRAPGGPRPDMRMRGNDQHYQLQVSFLEAANGASRRLSLPDGRTLDVSIPAGLEDGQTLRLRGQGDAGWNGGIAGDALIEVAVQPHPFFRREGADIHLELPVTAGEAALGAKVTVPTPSGAVALSIPRHSDAGKQLRLRGRGIPAHAGRAAGDLYITLKIVLGVPDAALEAALQAYYQRHPLDPRADMMAQEEKV